MYTIDRRVYYSDVDEKGYLSLKGMYNMFQDCATMHSHDCGYTIDWLLEKKRGWLLTSHQTHLYRTPRITENLKIKTAAVGSKGFIGYRLFFIEDEDGNLVTEGYSEWAYMDLAAERPIRVTPEEMEVYHIDDIPYDKWQSRKIELDGEKTLVDSFKTENYVLDTNGHMNNVYYVAACDAFIKDYKYNHIRAEFKKSAKLNDKIQVFSHGHDTKKLFTLEDENGLEYFKAEFSYRSEV